MKYDWPSVADVSSCSTVSVSHQPQWCGVCSHLRSGLYGSCCSGTPLMNKPSLKALEKLLLSGAGQQPSSVGRLQDYRLMMRREFHRDLSTFTVKRAIVLVSK